MNTQSAFPRERRQPLLGGLMVAALVTASFAAVSLAPAQGAQASAVQPLRLRDVKAVASGLGHTCALLNSGSVKCWGVNNFGQLGDGTTTDSAYPVEVSGVTNAAQIAAGGDFTCIINNGGTVKCWGKNDWGQLGAGLLDTYSSVPLAIDTYGAVDAIDAGLNHVCALIAANGDARCWGANNLAQVGLLALGYRLDRPNHINWGLGPKRLTGVGGLSTCFADETAVSCWGANGDGQLGRGYKSLYEEAATGTIPNLPNVVSIHLGYSHACALQFAIILAASCWGDNDSGEIGTGGTSDVVWTPTLLTSLRTAPTDLTLGWFYTCAELADDTAQCWGDNSAGQLGNGTYTPSSSPVDVSGLTDVAQISAGSNHMCAVLNSGEVKCWGANKSNGTTGILGTGNLVAINLPTPEFVVERPLILDENPIDLDDVFPDVPTATVDYEYGDAPDEDPATGNDIDAYSGVPGRFPTLDGPNVKGPKHANPRLFTLGDSVTLDAAVDEDGVPNLDTTNLVANLDGADDGWLNQHDITRFDNCQPVTLRVRVRRDLLAVTNVPLYLNAWFDGNRDGDWKDSRVCETGDTAYEWMVQNYKVKPLPALNGYVDIDVTTKPVLVNSAVNPAWVRITLSDQNAITPTNPAGALPDGRGLDTGYFDYGETEDYLWDPVTVREKYGDWSVTKSITTSSPITVGSTFNYVIEVSRTGGTQTNVVASLVDVLPPETEFVSGVLFNEITPSVFPASAVYEPSYGGPSGRVRWIGAVTNGARFRLRFQVKINACPPDAVTNVVTLVLPGAGKIITSSVATSLVCAPPPPPTIALNKQMVDAVGATVLTGPQISETVYLLTLVSSGVPGNTLAAMEDRLPSGLTAVEVNASAGVISITNSGRTVRWLGVIGPTLASPKVWLRVQVTDPSYCGQPLNNLAAWAMRDTTGQLIGGQSNTATFTPQCAPLPTPTATPPVDGPTSTPTPTASPSAPPTYEPTYTPVPVETNTPVPLPTDAPPKAPTNTPVPRATNTSVPRPTGVPSGGEGDGIRPQAWLPLIQRGE